MDVSAGFDIANPYGLLASDMNYDMGAYRSALGFLSDLTGGSEEAKALEANGGSPMLLKAWESSPKFRRVLAKCRAAAARGRAEKTAGPDAALTPPRGQQFIPLDEMPARNTLFGLTPRPGSWGTP